MTVFFKHGNVCSASSPMCNGFLRLTSGATSVDLVTASIGRSSKNNDHTSDDVVICN